jgi:hypothetical protein
MYTNRPDPIRIQQQRAEVLEGSRSLRIGPSTDCTRTCGGLATMEWVDLVQQPASWKPSETFPAEAEASHYRTIRPSETCRWQNPGLH